MFNKIALEACKSTHEKLHMREQISDEELNQAIPIYRDVVAFFEALWEPKFALFLNYLREDLRTLQGFKEARKNKL